MEGWHLATPVPCVLLLVLSGKAPRNSHWTRDQSFDFPHSFPASSA